MLSSLLFYLLHINEAAAGAVPMERMFQSVLLLKILLSLTLGSLGTNLLIVLLQGSKILASLRKLALLHAFPNVPVDECSLCVHEVKLVIDAAQSLSNCSGICNHAHSTLHTGEVTTRDDSRRLVVNTALEASRTPIHELDGTLRLDCCNSCINVLGYNVTTVHKAASHVLAMARVALSHHTSRLEHRVGNLGDRELLVVGFFSRDDRSIGRKHEVDPRVGDQVRLELSDINIQGTIEPK
mmetsp:Transcript_55766/g.167115  ORF Transcript_55766/g.167115 Transcript_55766/m.167115 type:complete len:240 (-) Transcript_55766:874-1593(-)